MYINKKIKNLTTILKKNKIKISVAESCTGGLISYNLTKISGASKYFEMGVVTYSNKSKLNFLKIKPKTLTKYGSVSAETCKEMYKIYLKFPKQILQYP